MMSLRKGSFPLNPGALRHLACGPAVFILAGPILPQSQDLPGLSSVPHAFLLVKLPSPFLSNITLRFPVDFLCKDLPKTTMELVLRMRFSASVFASTVTSCEVGEAALGLYFLPRIIR